MNDYVYYKFIIKVRIENTRAKERENAAKRACDFTKKTPANLVIDQKFLKSRLTKSKDLLNLRKSQLNDRQADPAKARFV